MDSPAADSEPRKKLRVRVRPDLAVAAHRYEGRTYYVVKDPVSLRYYRYSEQEHFLMRLLDGSATLDQARQRFEAEFRPERLSLEDTEAFAQELLLAGLAHADSAGADRQLFTRRKEQRRTEWLQALTNVLYIKVPLFDPDKLLARLLPYLRWVYTTWFMLLSAGVILAAVLLVATHFETFRDRLPGSHAFFNVQTMVSVWVAFAVVKVIHEFGHGLSCKAQGGETHEMGLLFLCLSPCLYCNVSDAWVLPSKWRRMLIGFAGIYVELMIAALATFVWWNTPAQPWINHPSLILMVVCSVSTVVFNGNPLLRYDGYYVLADWIELPNLRSRANRFLTHLVLGHCLGITVPAEAYTAPWRRTLFVVYAVTSYVYGWVVAYGVLWVLHRLLEPYRLGAVSSLLACVAAGSLVGWPLWRLGKSLRQRGRLPEMKPLRLLLSAAALAGLAAFIALVPLPISQVRQAALVQLQPEAAEKVFVATPGILERLHVRDGQAVREGEILAEFRSLDVDNRLEEARSEYDIRTVQVRALRAQADRTASPSDRARAEAAVAAAAGERALFARQLEVYDKMRQRLVLRAPRAGVVMGPPRIDEVGKRWEKDEHTPFCTIGDPARAQALVPVSPADYRLLKDDLAHEPDLPVTIRVQGRDARTWRGKLARLPESEARVVPWALTAQAGGPLAVKPAARGNAYEPQSQQYLLGIDFLETDPAFCPGTLAQVKIRCRWRTTAWWLWRTLAGTFDLGLI